LGKKERKADRDGILANFQFYIDDRSKEILEGMTINISPHGFGFFTGIGVKEGQTITIIKLTRKSTMSDFANQKAKVIWVKKGSRYVEAGAKFLTAPLPG
jgi:PilZ domain